ncbi:MAG TPA: hypothetical protein DCX89_09275 [Saprospirales bacterium]|nr:hypothetical protein [Saprospirales bacterium]
MKKAFLIIIVIGLFIGAAAWYLVQSGKKRQEKRDHIRYIESMVGPVQPCAGISQFIVDQGIPVPALIDMRQVGYYGMKILENRINGKEYSHPTWDDFGYLGLYTTDKSGNIYVTSVPHVSIDLNPVGEQNRILKVDTKTGVMAEHMRLPQAAESTNRNPFGAVGLHYDCDNDFVYVTSLAGSGIKEELGRIYQVDIQDKKILSQLDNVDALGVTTFNTMTGKRLIYGLARKPHVYSVALDDKGKITGAPKMEFSLLDQPGGADDKAHRIVFNADTMMIKANKFTYTLAAASDPDKNIYRFSYNRQEDKWEFMDVFPQYQEQ